MLENKNTYIALTLGPITRTIEMAENTRGLWAASYLFSFLGKQIFAKFKDRTFLLPKISDEMFTDTFDGAGIFPDRYIFKSKDGDFNNLSTHVDKIMNELADKIAHEIGIKKEDKGLINNLHNFVERYFKVYFFEKDFETKDAKKIKTSCEESLALLEMQESIVPQMDDKESFLNRFFERVNNSFLTDDAGLRKGFPSIVDISSGDKKPEHPYQRYVAIVKADGDSMGKALEKIGDANKLSDALLGFNKGATETIKKHHGLPIYTGGDDLLFFAPVLSEKGSIFTLLQELDDVFHSEISEKTKHILDRKNHPTLSFGVSITYYKYPMFEALKLADNLLSKAKGYDAPEKESGSILKNNIVFSVQKHSGQTRSALLHKGNENTVKKFNELISNYLIKKDEKGMVSLTDIKKDDDKILASVMHGLREKEFMLEVAIKDGKTLKNFFENNFNESIHKNEMWVRFFDDIRNLMNEAYKENKSTLDKLKYSMPSSHHASAEYSAIETAYNALQFIHLINQRNDE